MMSLTAQQGRALAIIAEHLDRFGVAPSYQEIATGLRIRSKGRVHAVLKSLEERGAIRRLPNRVRAIEIVGAHQPAPEPGPFMGEEAALRAILRPEQIKWLKEDARKSAMTPSAVIRELITACMEA